MTWEYYFGVDPLNLLSNGAQKIIRESGRKPTHQEMKAVFNMTPQQRVRLSMRVEKNPGDSLLYYIEDLDKIPATVPVARDNKIKAEVQQHAQAIDEMFGFDFETHLRGFAGPSGAVKTCDYQEVLDSWSEAVAAWEMFRNKTNKISERR